MAHIFIEENALKDAHTYLHRHTYSQIVYSFDIAHTRLFCFVFLKYFAFRLCRGLSWFLWDGSQ